MRSHIPADTVISVKEAAVAMNVSARAVQRQIRRGDLPAKEVKGRGGRQYRIPLSALPLAIQERYIATRIPQQKTAEPKPPAAAISNAGLPPEAAYLTELPDYQRKELLRRKTVLDLVNGHRGRDLERKIEAINCAHPDYDLKVRTVQRWRNDYKAEGLVGITPAWGKTEGVYHSFEQLGRIGEEAYTYFRRHYLNEARPGAAQIWLEAKGHCIRIGESSGVSRDEIESSFPSARNFLARLKSEESESAIYYARFGRDAWNRKFGAFADRDYAGVEAGEIWVSDHALHDVLLDVGGKQKRAWLTAWSDFRTGKVLSSVLSFDPPNGQRIVDAFAIAAAEYGLPKVAIIDNGKDYKKISFSGGKRRKKKVGELNRSAELQVYSLLGFLGVDVHFALEYNAQSKPIERNFKDVRERFDKLQPGYCGRDARSRPEKLKGEIRRGELLSLAQFRRYWQHFLDNVYHLQPSQGKNLRGRSREQAWAEEFKVRRRITPAEQQLLRAEILGPAQVGRNGVRLGGQTWFGECCFQVAGEKALLLRLPETPNAAVLIQERGLRSVGLVSSGAFTTSAFARTEEEFARLREVLSLKRSIEKRTREAAKTVSASPEVRLDNAARAVASNAPRGEKIDLAKIEHETILGRKLQTDCIDERTGELLAERGTLVTPVLLSGFREHAIETLYLAPEVEDVDVLTEYAGIVSSFGEAKAENDAVRTRPLDWSPPKDPADDCPYELMPSKMRGRK